MRSIFAIISFTVAVISGRRPLCEKRRFNIAGFPARFSSWPLRVLAAQLERRRREESYGLCELPSRLAIALVILVQFRSRAPVENFKARRIMGEKEKEKERREAKRSEAKWRENCSEEMRHSALCPRDPDLFFRIRYCDYYYMITI